MKVYFGRERFRLDPESVERYLRKVQEGNAYTQALKVNTSKARRKRAENDHRMPSGGGTWFHEYHPYRKASGLLPTEVSGKHTLRPERALIGRRWATWILEEGRSLGECVRLTEKQFGVRVSRETLWRSLRDPSAIGKFYAYKTRNVASPTSQRVLRNPESEWLLVHEDPSLAVLTREEFDAIREKFRDNKEKSFRNTHRWHPPLRKRITHCCGRIMTGCYKGNDPWYRCWRCRAWLPARHMWQTIQARVRAILLDPALVLSVLKGREDNRQIVARLEDALRDIRRRLKELDQAETEAIRIRVYLGGQLSGPAQGRTLEKLAAELQRIADQREAQQREEASLRKQIEGLQLTAIDEAGLRRFCESARQNLEAWDDGQWRVVLEALRMKVAAGSTDVTVQLAVPMVRDEADVIVSRGSRTTSGKAVSPARPSTGPG